MAPCQILKFNIDRQFYNLISNIYSKTEITECSVKINNQRTDYFKYDRGVRQGCVLSPMLFNLYMNELPIALEKTDDCDPIILPNGPSLNSLFYADDLVLLSTSATGLQNIINTLHSYSQSWFLNVNAKKTKTIIFQKQCRKSTLEKHSFFSMALKSLMHQIILIWAPQSPVMEALHYQNKYQLIKRGDLYLKPKNILSFINFQ